MAAGPFDYLQPISTIANPEIFDSYAGVNDPQIGDPGFTGYTPSFDTPEQENTVQNIFGKVGQTVEGALTELGKIPGAIVDATNKTVDVFGKKLNVGKTLASIAINKAVGAPVTLVFDILKDIMPEQAIQTSIVDELKAEKDYGFNIQSGNLNQDPFGRNPVSGFGDYEGTLAEDAVSTSTTKMGLAKKEFAQDYFNKKAEYAGGVEVDEGTVLGPGEAPGDVVSLDDMLREQRDEKIDEGIQAADDDKGSDIDTFDTTPADTTNIVDEVALTGGKDKDDKPAPPAPPSPPTDTGGGGGGGGGADMGTAPKGGTYDAEAEDDQYESPTPTQDFYQDPITTGGGGNQGNPGGSTGGCCFIMLESRYGDGTMDKVVRRYRDEKMTPRNRRGYYKVARVLVPLMRKSKVFKWIVAKTFADPLVSYGKWYYGENKHGWIFAPIKTAWLKIFDVVGTDTVFIRENGEEV